MKKIITLVLALLICISATATAFATTFVASVENKGAPSVVEIKDPAGNIAVGKLNGVTMGEETLVPGVFLVVTAVKDVQNSEAIPDASEQALMEVYDGLRDGSISIPYEVLDEKHADELVVRDLFDISWTVTEENGYTTLLEKEGVSLEMTFQIDVPADKKIYVMVYKNDTWNQIERVTNNGDGTVTCVFAHLCPVAVVVEDSAAASSDNLDDQDVQPEGQNVMLWGGILAVSAMALAAVFAMIRKQK